MTTTDTTVLTSFLESRDAYLASVKLEMTYREAFTMSGAEDPSAPVLKLLLGVVEELVNLDAKLLSYGESLRSTVDRVERYLVNRVTLNGLGELQGAVTQYDACIAAHAVTVSHLKAVADTYRVLVAAAGK